MRQTLEEARVANGFTPGAFDPFAARLPRLLDSDARITYDGYVSHGLQDVIDRFVVRDGDRWTLATYVFPSSDAQATHIQAVVDAVDSTQALTGLALVNRELSRRFLPQFIRGLVIGSVVVIALVVAAFRDVKLSLFALLPTAIGLVWTAGVLAIAGVELDLFAVFAVVTLVGIGVDYGVHLVHRYQERGDAISATAELAPVILIAAAITLLGYGTLVASSYPPLRSIGVVSTVSVVALAVASVFVLPALLLRPHKAVTMRAVALIPAFNEAGCDRPRRERRPRLGRSRHRRRRWIERRHGGARARGRRGGPVARVEPRKRARRADRPCACARR